LRCAVLASSLRGIPRVFDSVDSIAHLFEQTGRLAPRLRQRLIARLELGRTRHFEARAPLHFERTLVTSLADAQALRALAGERANGRIVVLPNGVDLDYFRPAGAAHDPATIVFSGKMSYHANSAAALYLAREIMPRVWTQRPDAQLLIVGKDPSSAVRALSVDPRIAVTGFVDDVRPYFARATVAVAPLLYGAGIQNKVLEAMAGGVPVVTISNVNSSLKAQPGQDILIGDNAEQLANHALRVIEDSALQRTLGQAGRQYVEHHHDWREIGRQLVAVYEKVAYVQAQPESAPLTAFIPR
jgi:glycosyltransferase involved in cell wall biosynthesis